jgi:hypothetical protein
MWASTCPVPGGVDVKATQSWSAGLLVLAMLSGRAWAYSMLASNLAQLSR